MWRSRNRDRQAVPTLGPRNCEFVKNGRPRLTIMFIRLQLVMMILRMRTIRLIMMMIIVMMTGADDADGDAGDDDADDAATTTTMMMMMRTKMSMLQMISDVDGADAHDHG